MSDIVIKIENLSKLYRLGEVGTGTLSHDLNRWWQTKIMGREDPYTKVGHINDRTQKAEKGEHVWALKDINLEVKQGEVLGIIGKNGAGKSTLLKLLSRVTSPTTGTIKIKGRLASLLEVGTGFHPEMTGRENIYMNGTIMGMRKREIDKKLDEIVDFAGVAKYLDTPTKRYSSGMTVRLAFAIAAFLEPEILVVDEVLAVGDAEFQKKAIGKMQDVSKGEGRTVLFVSHNMGSVRKLCTNGIILETGRLKFNGTVVDAISKYILGNRSSISSSSWYTVNNKVLENCKSSVLDLVSVKLENKSRPEFPIASGDDLKISIFFNPKQKVGSPAFVVKFFDKYGTELMRFSNLPISGYEITNFLGSNCIDLTILKLPLVKGVFSIDIGFVHESVTWFLNGESIVQLYVEGYDVYDSGLILDDSRGLIWAKHKWRAHNTANKNDE